MFDGQIVAALIATLGSVIAAIVSALAQRSQSKRENAYEPGDSQDIEYQTRLWQARSELNRQEGIATWQGRSATALTFSQYIIGGVLATSFIQETMSSGVVGFLGLLVLISSLLHQHFRPDLQRRSARERVISLRHLIRSAEDDLFAISNGKLEPDSIHGIRANITHGLSEIEKAELQDLDRTSEANIS